MNGLSIGLEAWLVMGAWILAIGVRGESVTLERTSVGAGPRARLQLAAVVDGTGIHAGGHGEHGEDEEGEECGEQVHAEKVGVVLD
jgi:hypothetical protein